LGVSIFHKTKWESWVTFEGKKKKINYDTNEVYAARRRDIFLLDNFSNEPYKMNFEWTEKDITK